MSARKSILASTTRSRRSRRIANLEDDDDATRADARTDAERPPPGDDDEDLSRRSSSFPRGHVSLGATFLWTLVAVAIALMTSVNSVTVVRGSAAYASDADARALAGRMRRVGDSVDALARAMTLHAGKRTPERDLNAVKRTLSTLTTKLKAQDAAIAKAAKSGPAPPPTPPPGPTRGDYDAMTAGNEKEFDAIRRALAEDDARDASAKRELEALREELREASAKRELEELRKALAAVEKTAREAAAAAAAAKPEPEPKPKPKKKGWFG